MRSLLVILMLSALSLFGQNDWQFKRIGLKQGLSNTFASSIIKDHQGYIWIATRNGINRFNAYEFTTFNYDVEDPNSINSDVVHVVFEDAAQRVWLGTDKGMNLYDRKLGKFTKVMLDSINGVDANQLRILDIVQDQSGQLWVATWGQGTLLFKPEEHKLVDVLNTRDQDHYRPAINIRQLFIDSKNNLWIGGNGSGVTKVNTKTYQAYTWHSLVDSLVPMETAYCFEIFEDPKGDFWIGTFVGGLLKLDKSTNNFRLIYNPNNREAQTKNGILSIELDDEGKLLLGSNGGGLFRFDPETEEFVANYKYDATNAHSLPNDFVDDIYKDNEGIYWFGTEDGGVATFDPGSNKFNAYGKVGNGPNDLPGTSINTIYEAPDKRIWVGTENNGFAVLNAERTSYEQYILPNAHMAGNNTFITAITGDGGNGVWVGGKMGGIAHFSEEGKIMKHYAQRFQPDHPQHLYDHDITKIKYKSHDELWIGGIKGFGKKIGDDFYQLCFDESRPDGFCNEAVSDIESYKDSILIIAYYGGGVKIYSPIEKKFIGEYRSSKEPSSLSSDKVNDICIDQKGRIWIATNKGMNLMNLETGEFIKWYKKDGLPNDQICSILEDDMHQLWIATTYGLSRYSPDKEEFKNFYEEDGLLSNVFREGAAFKSNSGELFFGGVNGFVSFFPGGMSENKIAPKVVLTNFKILNKDVVPGPDAPIQVAIEQVQSIELHYGQESFTFEMAALNFKNPEKNEFAYQLEGLNDDWVYIGTKRHISFTSLPHGDYILKIKASNNDGYWNEEGLSIPITIYPPFWNTWWFRTLIVLAIIAGIWIFMKKRVANLKKRQEELERNVEERTKEIRLQKELIESKNNEILDSINYAKRIQTGILPSDNMITSSLNDAFVLYKPKDIVAGDFYWLQEKDDKVLFAAADCTGHGVPGAMVSVICNNGLNRSVREYGLTEPGKILDQTRTIVIQEFEKSNEDVKDGMDIALCSLKGNTLEYAGAHNPLWIVRKDAEELEEIKANKEPIGQFDNPQPYTTHKVKLNKGDTFYIFSDGFADQFGGPNGKKFKTVKFKKLLLSIQNETMAKQKHALDRAFKEWKGDLEQLDDVCVIGVRV